MAKGHPAEFRQRAVELSRQREKPLRELASDGVRVAVACRMLRVSTSGYYEQRGRPPSVRAQADHALTLQIREIPAISRGTYGVPRVFDELRLGRNVRCGRKRVARLMSAASLCGVYRRRRKHVRPLPAVHDDLVQRRFVAEAPDRLWLTDITEHPTREGKVYLAAVLDVFSRRIVGWSIADHLRSELVVDALEMARWRRRPTPGRTVLHSGRGAQYTSWAFGHRLRQAGLLGSMGRVGSAYDNAMMESFFGTTRAARPQAVADSQGAGVGDLRVDQGLVQPAPPSHLERQPQPRRLRATVHSRSGCGMIVQETNCPEKRGKLTSPITPNFSVQVTLPKVQVVNISEFLQYTK